MLAKADQVKKSVRAHAFSLEYRATYSRLLTATDLTSAARAPCPSKADFVRLNRFVWNA